MRHTLRYGLIALAMVGFTCSEAEADVIASSTFGADLGGWTSNTPSQIAWQSTGGNPGGYLQFTDASGDSTVVLAPASFLGNYASLGVSSISFDDNIIAETLVGTVYPYEIDLSGPGGSATFLGNQPPSTYPTGWITVTAAISTGAPPSGWTVNSGTWLGLLANVNQVQIPIELITNSGSTGTYTDVEGIDNVTLTGSPASVPEPASLSLMFTVVLGLAWRLRRRTP